MTAIPVRLDALQTAGRTSSPGPRTLWYKTGVGLVVTDNDNTDIVIVAEAASEEPGLVHDDDPRLTDDRTASGLRTATTVVSISGSTAPTAGQVLQASSGTSASWATPVNVSSLASGGGITASSSTGAVTLGSAAGGDAAGSVDALTVTGLQGVSVAAPTDNITCPVFTIVPLLGTSVVWRPPLLADADAIFQNQGGNQTREISIDPTQSVGDTGGVGDHLLITASEGIGAGTFNAGGLGGSVTVRGAKGGDGNGTQLAGKGGGLYLEGGYAGADGGAGTDDGGEVQINGGLSATGINGSVAIGADHTRFITIGNDSGTFTFEVKASGLGDAVINGPLDIVGGTLTISGGIVVSDEIDAGVVALSISGEGSSPAVAGYHGLLVKESAPLGWAIVAADGSIIKKVTPITAVSRTATGTYQITLGSGSSLIGSGQKLTGRIQLNGSRGFADVPIVSGPATTITVTTRNTSDTLTDMAFTIWLYAA